MSGWVSGDRPGFDPNGQSMVASRSFSSAGTKKGTLKLSSYQRLGRNIGLKIRSFASIQSLPSRISYVGATTTTTATILATGSNHSVHTRAYSVIRRKHVHSRVGRLGGPAATQIDVRATPRHFALFRSVSLPQFPLPPPPPLPSFVCLICASKGSAFAPGETRRPVEGSSTQ